MPVKPDLRQRLRARRQAVDLGAAPVTLRPLAPGPSAPLLVEPAADGVELADWARRERQAIERRLLTAGALLFRGFGLRTVNDFETVARGLCGELFGDYGDLPQGGGERVYKSTPYPADKTILFHNEASHTGRWPMKQLFFCVRAARRGGETPIADCRLVYRRLPPAMRRELAGRALLYVRRFIPGLDVGWQDFFKTADRGEVEARCRHTGASWEWTSDGGLEVRQQAPAVAAHPWTGEALFFNQLQLHHPVFLDPEVRRTLATTAGGRGLPREVRFGDGGPIPDDTALQVLAVYRGQQATFRWREGDVLLVDNMLVAHSRNPYEGPREIAVAMGEMLDRRDLGPPPADAGEAG